MICQITKALTSRHRSRVMVFWINDIYAIPLCHHLKSSSINSLGLSVPFIQWIFPMVYKCLSAHDVPKEGRLSRSLTCLYCSTFISYSQNDISPLLPSYSKFVCSHSMIHRLKEWQVWYNIYVHAFWNSIKMKFIRCF